MYSEIKLPPFRLENGTLLTNPVAGFSTFGKLNAAKSNVIWVCHGLTANSDVQDWWSGLFGAENLFSEDKYFIVCVNTLGSCYGSTGPTSSLDGETPLLENFPLVTTRDQAKVFEEVRKALEIERIYVLVGASLGGQQALEWSILNQNVADKLILIATNARHSAFGIAFNESQRMAIQSDPTFGNGNAGGGKAGLKVARSIALLSYRSYSGYQKTQAEKTEDCFENFKASSYQQYQGEKLIKRFDAYSYLALTKSMDSHNVGRGRVSLIAALGSVKTKTLVIGVSSDHLFPTVEQKFLSIYIPNADYVEIASDYGHDGFLIETEQLSNIMSDFLLDNFKYLRPTVFKTTTKKNQLMNLVAINRSVN